MIDAESRYNYAAVFRLYDHTGRLIEREHFDLRPPLANITHNDNQTVAVADGDNWSRIAWRRLGKGTRWWIIADYSDVIDPFTATRTATVLTYAARLSGNIAAGTVTSFTVTDVRRVRIGTVLRVENLDPASPVSFDASVLSVNTTSKLVTVTPVTCAAPGIPALLARVSTVTRRQATLVCPSVNRAMFDALNFADPTGLISG